jgi:RNA polymerase sigma-70 factor (ECF subfamily)
MEAYVPDKWQNITDEEVMLELQKGSDSALSELFKRYKSPLYYFIYRMLRQSDKAEDVLQETFFRVFRYRKEYKPTSKFSSWIYRIARNLCIDEKRRYWNRKISLDSEIAADDDATDYTSSVKDNRPNSRNVVIEKEMEEEIIRAIETLSPEQQEVIMLNKYQGLSYGEIADILNISSESVKQRAYRAHQQLRTILAPLMEEV